MNVALCSLVLLTLVVALTACTSSPMPANELVSYANPTHAKIGETLDALHDAASKADEERYFALFDDKGVFIGTDASERWTVTEFRAYAKPYFSQGKGWTYVPTSREIHVSRDGRTAWFHEMLRNEKWGVCRGSGVLVRSGRDGPWRIAQYNLSVPIPNDLLPEFAGRIREFEAGAR